MKFDYPELKTDSINLMVSVKNRTVIAARNKSHLKNFGEKAMTPEEVAQKFAGRDVGTAYNKAMVDLQAAIGALTDAQIKKIFDEGRKWLSIEVMGHGGKNIIDYGGLEELRLHGTLEHNEAGEAISQINKADARIFDGMLRQRTAERQTHFTIKNLTRGQFSSIKGVDNHKKVLVSKLKRVMGKSKSIGQYKVDEMTKIISSKTKNQALIDTLVDRWAKFQKAPSITQIYKQFPDDKAWIQAMEKDSSNIFKNIMLPLEYIFLELGSVVLGALNVFMSLDPEHTKKDLSRQLDNAIKMINSKGDEKMKAKLALELKRLEAAGGMTAVSAEEGITFFVDGEFVKLTGTFAPLNQILGMTYRL